MRSGFGVRCCAAAMRGAQSFLDRAAVEGPDRRGWVVAGCEVAADRHAGAAAEER
jgi:hypothetical protein